MSVRLWDIKNLSSPMMRAQDRHTEFVQGVDWSNLVENQVGSVSWDQRAFVWNIMGPQAPHA